MNEHVLPAIIGPDETETPVLVPTDNPSASPHILASLNKRPASTGAKKMTFQAPKGGLILET
jgi:hypothetical protein